MMTLLSSSSLQQTKPKENDGNCHHPLCNKPRKKKDDGIVVIVFFFSDNENSNSEKKKTMTVAVILFITNQGKKWHRCCHRPFRSIPRKKKMMTLLPSSFSSQKMRIKRLW
jgi:hypothetical protein